MKYDRTIPQLRTGVTHLRTPQHKVTHIATSPSVRVEADRVVVEDGNELSPIALDVVVTGGAHDVANPVEERD